MTSEPRETESVGFIVTETTLASSPDGATANIHAPSAADFQSLSVDNLTLDAERAETGVNLTQNVAATSYPVVTGMGRANEYALDKIHKEPYKNTRCDWYKLGFLIIFPVVFFILAIILMAVYSTSELVII